MEHGTDGQIPLEVLEGLFHRDELQIEVPQLRGIGFREIGAQQVATLAAHYRDLETTASIDDDGALTPSMLLLTADAKVAWVALHDAIEGELRNGGELYDVRDVASKTADNAVRLAAQFQVLEHDMGGAVGLEPFEGASRIAAWHLNESRRFFGELALPAELADAARLDSWLIDYCQRERTHSVTTRRIQEYGPSGAREKDAIDAVVGELNELGRARLMKEGRHRKIEVNPALLAGGVKHGLSTSFHNYTNV